MSMMGNSAGTNVLGEGASEEKGEHARLASFVGAMAISDLVKSTLGPKGMDKILVSMVRSSTDVVMSLFARVVSSSFPDAIERRGVPRSRGAASRPIAGRRRDVDRTETSFFSLEVSRLL
jgi:hypothetical protein|tara:strand:- start:3279 stop:3638 length:360 start_codon:yes stop_codon:yes gene_type:complete|eukprot:31105-Pelagococcus_subviridis.AAC.16